MSNKPHRRPQRYTSGRYQDFAKQVNLHSPEFGLQLPGRLDDAEAEMMRELGNQERGGQVALTYFPTKTSNPEDPRTAAAGYDPTTQTLRVAWGDGGQDYNYYNVPPNAWRNFQRVGSPGRLINRTLNNFPYGPA
jgi:hypothetical protein